MNGWETNAIFNNSSDYRTKIEAIIVFMYWRTTVLVEVTHFVQYSKYE